jgi:hypothetical protein
MFKLFLFVVLGATLKSIWGKLVSKYKYRLKQQKTSTGKGADDPSLKFPFFAMMTFIDEPPSFASAKQVIFIVAYLLYRNLGIVFPRSRLVHCSPVKEALIRLWTTAPQASCRLRQPI